ncbi:hypothetical protein [Desulfomonile tiedjei]|uniref:Uncharacterized protein n=1 Tax=Desulfomonile tiedjei (strain ATCC 49306 / DSM 6799 / DCB-1) TaxID=706587 RepID=I4C971_DESTA|nr:hypothetical protein [Desulfomonile tiedjei]AFM26112.1 hypothetical protein Desti_3460 [Desulfomonile tiedjei DSM 6799]
MEDFKDSALDPDEFIRAWHEYGLRFSVFVPDQQPKPDTWEPDVQKFDEKGLTNPHYLKHWKFFASTKDFLRERYAEHKILQGPTLFFDCLVPEFQDPMRYGRVEAESGPDFYEVKDTSKWYERAIRMGIFDWQIGFSCRSVLCQRTWCDMHRGNPHRINHVDIYGLMTVFEKIPAVTGKSQVAKWFEVKLGDLKSTGKRVSSRWRRKVAKDGFYALIKNYENMRTHQVKEMISRLHSLITGSPVVEWHRRLFDGDHAFIADKAASHLHKIKGPAAKAYVWLLIRQEELAQDTRGPKLNVSDAELGQAIGVTKTTAQNYRQILMKLKLIETSRKTVAKIKQITITKVKY